MQEWKEMLIQALGGEPLGPGGLLVVLALALLVVYALSEAISGAVWLYAKIRYREDVEARGRYLEGDE